MVFCTAYDDYALQALEQQAAAYLLKPVREDKLRAAIESAGRLNRVQLESIGQGGGARAHITADSHRGLEMVAVSDIRCFVAEQKYVKALSPGGELVIPDSLKELEQEFGEQFLRVHRNSLVNLQWVVGLQRSGEQWVVHLHDCDVSPVVSRRLLGEVKQQLRRR